ncbi:MAG: hypothetical protein E6J34_09350 [Chloroflexi bacterium]|nr:MAG: hypothetical protein E6J34_09350 [Chloroflexota bacterium]
MNAKLSTYIERLNVRRLQPLIPMIISLLVALISGIILFRKTFFGQLTGIIVNIGLDLQRSQLIAALIIILGTTLIASALGRSKLGAMIGASILFCIRYLYSFLRFELQPVYDPGRHLEPLDGAALVHAVIVILSLALVSAFCGAAIGVALGECLLDPFYQLAQLIRRRLRKEQSTAKPQEQGHIETKPNILTRATFINWSGAMLLLVLLALVGQSGPLFLFSPDVGVHTAPKLTARKNGQFLLGTIIQDNLISPALKNQKKAFMVYLPPSYLRAEGHEIRYPVLYLLHGSPGGIRDWFTGGKADESANTLINTGQIPELIIVSPDGNGRPGATSEWGNSFDQQQLMETYLAIDLVKYVDEHYRTIPDAAHRAIGGLSMGGFGAANIAIHHPDVFGTVISLGGYYRAEGAIWGKDAAYMAQNSPADVLAHESPAWQLHFYIGAATTDQPYYNYAKQFIEELTTLHIPYKSDVQNGAHSWRVWQIQLYDALLWLKWE